MKRPTSHHQHNRRHYNPNEISQREVLVRLSILLNGETPRPIVGKHRDKNLRSFLTFSSPTWSWKLYGVGLNLNPPVCSSLL